MDETEILRSFLPVQLTGIHHLTAITAEARRNHDFYTQTLGQRLVKKTVNQDDVSAYHLFYADGLASPGTDLTFFDWPAPRERRGTHSIVRTGLRVASETSLNWWRQHLAAKQVAHGEIVTRDGRATLDLEDPEGQRLSLVVDDGREPANPWAKSPVPAEHQIRGLGPITLSVPALEKTELVLTKVLNMRRMRDYRAPLSTTTIGQSSGAAKVGDEAIVHVFEMGGGGAAAELHVAVEKGLPVARQGAGAVHHVAFRVPTFAEYDQWAARLEELGMRSSGPVNRFYFRSLYFREPGGILFELATDEPGFTADEPLDQLGEKLALPPFLEGRRKEIEAGLKPI